MIPNEPVSKYPESLFKIRQQKINDLFQDSDNQLWIAGNHDLIKMKKDGKYSVADNHGIIMPFRNYWQKSFNNGPSKDPLVSAAISIDDSSLPEYEENIDYEFYRLGESSNKSILFSTRYGIFNFNMKLNKYKFLSPFGLFTEFAEKGDSIIAAGWEATFVTPKINSFFNQHYRTTADFTKGIFNFTNNSDPRNVNRIWRQGDTYWYASWSEGLWMTRDMTIKHFNTIDSTISKNINDVCFDDMDHLIYGSNSGEVYSNTLKGDDIKKDYSLESGNGIQGSTIKWLVPDGKGFLWAGTNLGINCIDLHYLYSTGKSRVRFFNQDETLINQPLNRAVADSSGNLWIAARDQILKFDTRKFISDSSAVNKLIILSVEINHKQADTILKYNSYHGKEGKPGKFILKHFENDLVFRFDVRNYRNPGEDRFRYLLRGYDKDFSEWSSDRQAIYQPAPWGIHSFCGIKESWKWKPNVSNPGEF